MERYKKGVKTNNPEPEFHFNEPVFKKRSYFREEFMGSTCKMGIDLVKEKRIDKKCQIGTFSDYSLW